MHFNEAGRAKLDAGEPITQDDLTPFRQAPMLEHQPAPVEAPDVQETEASDEQLMAALRTSLDAVAQRVGVSVDELAELRAAAPADAVAHANAHAITQARVHTPRETVDDDGGVFYLGGRARPQIVPPKRPRFGP